MFQYSLRAWEKIPTSSYLFLKSLVKTLEHTGTPEHQARLGAAGSAQLFAREPEHALCGVCGPASPVLHMRIRAAGRCCESSCPHCAPAGARERRESVSAGS